MRPAIGILAVFCLGAIAQAMAMDPPTSSSASDSQSKSPNAETAPGTVKLVAGDADAEAQLKRFKAMGYKAEMHGKNVLFCRKEPVLGSHFEQKQCNTADELEKKMLDSQEATKLVQQNLGKLPRGSN